MSRDKRQLRKLFNEACMSDDLLYHVKHDCGVDKNIFRPGSDKFFSLFREARYLSQSGLYELSAEEKMYVEDTDIGEFAIFEGSVVPLDYPMLSEGDVSEAEYRGRKVKLNKPKRGGSKKYYVYVNNPKTKNVIRVEWGARGMSVGIDDPDRRKSFVARHKCKTTKDKTSARYWACRTGRYPHLTGSKKKHRWW